HRPLHRGPADRAVRNARAAAAPGPGSDRTTIYVSGYINNQTLLGRPANSQRDDSKLIEGSESNDPSYQLCTVIPGQCETPTSARNGAPDMSGGRLASDSALRRPLARHPVSRRARRRPGQARRLQGRLAAGLGERPPLPSPRDGLSVIIAVHWR